MDVSCLRHKCGQKKEIAATVQTLKSKSLTHISMEDIALRDKQVSEAILSFGTTGAD